MLSEADRANLISKREEKLENLNSKNIYIQTNESKSYHLKDRNITCRKISCAKVSEAAILVSGEIPPRMLPFSFSMELELSCNILSEENGGIVVSDSVELIEYKRGERDNED